MTVYDVRLLKLLEGVFADGAVMADALDVQETSVGLKADLSQGAEVVQPFTDGEVVRVIDGGFGAQSASFFMILMDLGAFVVHIQGRAHTVCDDASTETSGGTSRHPTIKDQLDLVRTPQVEILPQNLLEEHPPGQGSVEDLSKCKFGLQHGQVIRITGLVIFFRIRMWQACKPFIDKPSDVDSRKVVANALEKDRILARQKAVVQTLIGNAPLVELTLGILMTIDAQLGRVREVRAKLEKEQPEILVHAVKVEVVDHRGGTNDPRIGRSRIFPAPPLRSKHDGFLLGASYEDHALVMLETLEVFPGDILLTLTFLEAHQRNPLVLDEPAYGLHEGP